MTDQATHNYSEVISDAARSKIKKMNTNITYEQALNIIDSINNTSLNADYYDRTGVMDYLNISDREFTRLIDKGNSFKKKIPLLTTTRIKGRNGKYYLVSDLDELLEKGLVRQRKPRMHTQHGTHTRNVNQ